MSKIKRLFQFNRLGKTVRPEQKSDSRGFTLGELLIVVAILGVIVAVSVPIFNSHRDEAKESVCLGNRTAFKQALTIQMMTRHYNYTELVNSGYFENHKEEYKCPSGGVYSLKMISDGNLLVDCSVHGTVTFDVLMMDVATSIGEWEGAYVIDGQGTNGTNYQKVKAELDKLGVDLERDYGARLWAAIRYTDNTYPDRAGKIMLVWSTWDAYRVPDNESTRWARVPAICFDEAQGKYIVGMSAVNISTANGQTYPIIAKGAQDGGFSPPVNKVFDTYDQAIQAYNGLKPSTEDTISMSFDEYIEYCKTHDYY